VNQLLLKNEEGQPRGRCLHLAKRSLYSRSFRLWREMRAKIRFAIPDPQIPMPSSNPSLDWLDENFDAVLRQCRVAVRTSSIGRAQTHAGPASSHSRMAFMSSDVLRPRAFNGFVAVGEKNSTPKNQFHSDRVWRPKKLLIRMHRGRRNVFGVIHHDKSSAPPEQELRARNAMRLSSLLMVGGLRKLRLAIPPATPAPGAATEL